MQTLRTRLLIFSCCLIASSLIAKAQEKHAVAKPPSDGTFKVLTAKPAIGKVVKGAPYSATATTETVQTLADGNQIVRRNESKLYRDSEGRTRTEQTLATIGKWTAGGDAQQLIVINDPVAGVYYHLDPRTRSANKQAYLTQKPVPVWNENFKVNGQPISQAEFEALMEKKRQSQDAMAAARSKADLNDPELKKKLTALQAEKMNTGQRTTQSLGKQIIEGVEAEGMRTTYTIPTGEVGNTRPIEVVDEAWYAPALQIIMLTKHSDPRSGETIYRLTNLNRNEPDRALFEVPANYTVKENTFPQKPKPIKEEE